MKKQLKEQRNTGSKTTMIKAGAYNLIRKLLRDVEDKPVLTDKEKLELINKTIVTSSQELRNYKFKRKTKQSVAKQRMQKELNKFFEQHPEFKSIENANGALDEFIQLQKASTNRARFFKMSV